MAPAFSKLSDPLRQLFCALLILLSLMWLVQADEAETNPKIRCSVILEKVLFDICLNGFNKKDLDGTLRLLRGRRHADLFLLPLQLKTQSEREASAARRKGKRWPTRKQMMKENARWRRRHRITGKRMRREERRKPGIADECCSSGCAKSDIATYCDSLL